MESISLKTLPLIIVIVCATQLRARPQSISEVHTTEHKALMSEIWETFDLLMYRVDKKQGRTVYTPFFPPKLAQMNNRKVRLQGYMIPITSGFRHNTFLFSVLPIHQCMFCGSDGIPAMVEVSLANQVKEKIKDKPVTVSGTVKLNPTDKSKTEILIVNGQIVSSNR